jgi:hypothetical protein
MALDQFGELSKPTRSTQQIRNQKLEMYTPFLDRERTSKKEEVPADRTLSATGGGDYFLLASLLSNNDGGCPNLSLSLILAHPAPLW